MPRSAQHGVRHELRNDEDQIGRYVVELPGVPPVASRVPGEMRMYTPSPRDLIWAVLRDERRAARLDPDCFRSQSGGSGTCRPRGLWGTSLREYVRGVNPALTTMALASRLADRLAERTAQP